MDLRYDGKRYWREPVCLVVNYMIGDGLARAGLADAAGQFTASSLGLIRTSGFAEFYGPQAGEDCGGARFTRTAALVPDFFHLETAV